jgi:hypothetical protein
VENPFTLKIYDKNFDYVGHIGNPISLVVTPRWCDIGTATIVVDLDHRHAPDLFATGARMVIEKDGVFVMSGKVTTTMGEGPTVTAALTVSLKSDFRLLHNVLGWPVPSAAISAQTSEYAKYTGNAETIVKAVVTANMITRLGMPVTCPTNQNRGATVTDGISFRFHSLYEKLLPTIEKAGLGIDLRQSGAGIVCEVYEPSVYDPILTEESGVLQWWSWTSVDPTATRVVAGGQGEAAARVFRTAVDSTLETAHHDIVEVFKEATDADTAAVLTTRANEALAEGVGKSGFAVRLSETENFRYGVNGLVVGAMVTVDVGGVTRTDVLREVTMTYSRARGVEVVPVVGEVTDNPDKTIAQFLSRLKKSVSDLKVSK